MSPSCRTCGHAPHAHVEDSGPCSWRGAPPFDPCRCDAFEGESPADERDNPIDRDRFLADAERAFRICYPERWDALVRAVERGWQPVAPRGSESASFEQISIEAPEEEEPGIQQVELDARVGGDHDPGVRVVLFRPTSADEFLDRVEEAVAVQNWQSAFDNLREAMNQLSPHRAEMFRQKIFCPKCVRRIAEPSPKTSTADWARFWRGRCPTCQGPLILR